MIMVTKLNAQASVCDSVVSWHVHIFHDISCFLVHISMIPCWWLFTSDVHGEIPMIPVEVEASLSLSHLESRHCGFSLLYIQGFGYPSEQSGHPRSVEPLD